MANTAVGYQAGNNITTGIENTIVGAFSTISAVTGVNQTVIGSGVTGQQNNSVTLGNSSVTDVFMASDKGATVHCGNLNFFGGGVSSGGANALDDYEEGTWTPVLKSGSNTISFSDNGTAVYTKIGNKVTVSWSFRNVTTSGTLASGTTIQGLPFTAGTANYSIGSVFHGFVLHFDAIPNVTRVETGTTEVNLLNQPASANYGSVTIDAVGSGSYGGFTITYFV